jgi:hypothetical protein
MRCARFGCLVAGCLRGGGTEAHTPSTQSKPWPGHLNALLLCATQLETSGFAEPEDIPRRLACVDLYVCPSVVETYGISVVQAMAMGLPVVHFGVGGMQVGPAACTLSSLCPLQVLFLRMRRS